MKLLVSCPRKLLLVDSTTGGLQVVESHRPEYYGISWSEDGRTLCLGHSGIENASLGTLQSYMDSELGWLSFGEVQGPRALSMTHQLLCVGDRVIATNTGRNCLTVFRTDDWFYRHYWVDDIRWDRKGRENSCGSHFNSIYLRDDLLYVIAHNHDRGSAVIRLTWPEMEVVGIDPTTTFMAHNVWVTEEGQVIVCDSMRGTIVDVASGEVLWKCEVPDVVTRGLACDGQHVLIGHSAIGTREARVNRDSRVWVVERSSWRTVGSLLLPASGNVHEIRILDRPDLCHHGAVFQGVIPTCGASEEAAKVMVGPPVSPAERIACDSAALDRWEQHVSFAAFDGRRARAAHFSLATLSELEAVDVTVRAHVDVRAAEARHAGIVARYGGPADTNMVVALLAKAHVGYRVQLWCQHDGRWSRLQMADVRRGEGTLDLQLVGPQAVVAFDDRPLIRTTVPGPVCAGRVGIRSAHGTLDQFAAEPIAPGQADARRKSA